VIVIVLELSGSGHRASTTTPKPPTRSLPASQASTVGGVRFVSYNLNQVVARSPRTSVRRSTIKYPVLDANDDAIAFGAGSTWVLESTKPLGGPAKPLGTPDRSDCGALLRLDSSTMAATGTLALKRCPLALTFGDGSVWVLVATSGATVTVVVQSTSGASQVLTLDTKTLTTVGSVTIPQARGQATALTTRSGAAWLGTNAGWLYRIDSRTGRVTGARQLGTWVHSLSVSRRAIWITIALPAGKPATEYPGLDTLELNPTTGAVEHDTGLPLVLAAAAGNQVWGIFATPQHGSYIARIDPRTRTVAGVTSSPSQGPAFTPDTIAVNNDAAWIINTNLQTLTKVVPVR
jgi:hypothetical protein